MTERSMLSSHDTTPCHRSCADLAFRAQGGGGMPMEQIDAIKAFFTRRRRLAYLLAAAALALFAILFKKYELSWGGLAKAGVQLTHSIQIVLARQQPGDVVGHYIEAM